MVKKIVPYIVLIFFCIFTVIPLLSRGYFPMHDDTQPTRVHLMSEAIRHGQFPVRWVDELGYGYGYPLFNFYSPLPYYIGAAFELTGLDAISATKFMMGVGMILAGLSMYLLGSVLFGVWGGLVSSFLYVYAPYHAVQLYVRGAVGELWAYAFLPLILLGFVLQRKKNHLFGKTVGVVGLTGVILSHNITALITVMFLGVWLVVETIHFLKTKKSTSTIYIVSILLVSLGITAFFWMPALFESSFTKVETLTGGTNHFSSHFLYLDQLWDSPWGYAGSAPGRADGMSFKVGKLHLLIAALGFVWLLQSKKSNSLYKEIAVLTSAGLALAIFFMLSISLPIWNLVPLLAYVQYPWRLLSFTTFFVSLGAGFFTLWGQARDYRKAFLIFVCVLLGVVVIFNFKYFKPQIIKNVSPYDYTSTERIAWDISKISDEYLPKDFPTPSSPNELPSEKITISDAIIIESSDVKPHFISLVISAKSAAEIVFSIAYFPGWTVVVDSNTVQSVVRDGKIVLPVSEGRHVVTLYFQNTPIRNIANIISLLALVVGGGVMLHMKNRNVVV